MEGDGIWEDLESAKAMELRWLTGRCLGVVGTCKGFDFTGEAVGVGTAFQNESSRSSVRSMIDDCECSGVGYAFEAIVNLFTDDP